MRLCQFGTAFFVLAPKQKRQKIILVELVPEAKSSALRAQLTTF